MRRVQTNNNSLIMSLISKHVVQCQELGRLDQEDTQPSVGSYYQMAWSLHAKSKKWHIVIKRSDYNSSISEPQLEGVIVRDRKNGGRNVSLENRIWRVLVEEGY